MSGEAPNTNAVDPFDFEWDPILSKALSDAEQRGYERGRKEGIEEASKVSEDIAAKNAGYSDGPGAARVLEAIRQLLEVKG